jgi:hypothetical protein
MVNKNKNPCAQSIGISLSDFFLIPHIVANQLKIFTPVGIAIVIVTLVKYARLSTSIPTVNM